MSPEQPGSVSLEERLERIENKLDAVLNANLDTRVKLLETVVFSGVGVVLLAVLGAVVGLVVQGKA